MISDIKTDRRDFLKTAADLKASSAWQSVIRRGNPVYGRRTVEALLHRPKYELYDLDNDPHEVNNLADDPKLRPVLIELLDKLDKFQRDTDDPWGAGTEVPFICRWKGCRRGGEKYSGWYYTLKSLFVSTPWITICGFYMGRLQR